MPIAFIHLIHSSPPTRYLSLSSVKIVPVICFHSSLRTMTHVIIVYILDSAKTVLVLHCSFITTYTDTRYLSLYFRYCKDCSCCLTFIHH